jgi:hypothetical protein
MKWMMKLMVLAGAILESMHATSQADQILDFTFSFQNDPNLPNQTDVVNVSGTVSGNLVLDVTPLDRRPPHPWPSTATRLR